MGATTDRHRATRYRVGYADYGPGGTGGRAPGGYQLRVSDAERAEVADRLARHYGDGRLDKEEFDERVGRAMAAKTAGDFQGLFDDLPDLPGTTSGMPIAPGAQPPASYQVMRPRRRRGSVLPGLLVLMIIAITWPTMMDWSGPLVWLAFMAAFIMLASRMAHRRR